MSISIRESFSAEQTEHALGPDPFSPKRLRLLRALADAIFSEAPADPAARQENDELVASFAKLFFPTLPEEQARSQLALLVTTLLEEAAEEEKRKHARRDASTSEFDDCAAMANNSDNSELQQAAEAVVQQAMQERRCRPKDQALLNLLSRSTSAQRPAAWTSGGNAPLKSFSPNEEAMIGDLMRHFGRSRAEAIEELLDFGFL